MKKILITVSVLILLLVIAAAGYVKYVQYNTPLYEGEVHVHADFAIYINDKRLDLTGEKYQSSKGHEKSENIHLHDGDDHVVHRHANGVTFAQFLETIGFKLTDNCFTMDTGETYCADDTHSLTLYVNNQPFPNKLSYITQEKDRVLLYYGATDNPNIQSELDSVTDESCIHTGTCPERGVPKVETCGLTCDIGDLDSNRSWEEILLNLIPGHSQTTK